VILQAVGLAPDVRVAIGRLELRRGDRLLLCSDGVSNQISDEELRQIMTESDPREACETMIALANERGGEDNETVIVADVLGEDLAEPVEFETVTSTYEVLQAFETKPHKSRRRSPPHMRVARAQPQQAPTPAAPAPPDEPEIEVSDALPVLEAAANEPPSPDPTRERELGPNDSGVRRGWIQSLLGKLSRDKK